MIGSAMYAVVSMLLGTVVMRVLGADEGGIFFFAFSTLGQHVYTLAYFAMRPIQIVDVKREFAFGDYRNFRFLTSAAALLLAVIVAFVYAGASEKTAVIIIIAVYKILDALCDCFESEYQRDGHLDHTGMSMAFRTVISAAAFLIAAFTTKDLVLACAAMVIAMAAALTTGCVLPMKKVLAEIEPGDHTGGFSKEKTKKLFNASVWLALATVLDLYIFSASKYAVDAKLSSSLSGYYATIFIPTSIIYLLANFIIRPLLTKLSSLNDEGDKKSFRSIVRKMVLLIAGLTAAGMLAAWLLGPWALKLIMGNVQGITIEGLRAPLAVIIGGGGLYALACLFYYILVILKKQKLIFMVYLAGAIAAAILADVLVGSLGFMGGALAYVISMALAAGAFIVIYERS